VWNLIKKQNKNCKTLNIATTLFTTSNPKIHEIRIGGRDGNELGWAGLCKP